MLLKPSEIYFSQDSINNVFDKRCAYSYEPIGHTLDALCEGRSRVSEIPAITVVLKDGKWVTADNRRLWVFREMERLGKCDQIPVYQGNYIPPAKMTSYNGGTSVHVRGSPGGSWHNKPSARKPSASKDSIRSKAITSTNNFSSSNTGLLKDQRNILNASSPTSGRIFESPDTTTTIYNTSSNNRVSPVINMSTSISSNYNVKTSRPSSSTASLSQYVKTREISVSSTVDSPRTVSPSVDSPYTVASRTAAPRNGSGNPTPASSYSRTDDWSNIHSRQERITVSPSSRPDSNSNNQSRDRHTLLELGSATSPRRFKQEDKGCCIII